MTTDSRALVPLHNVEEVRTLGELLAKSGYFADTKDAAQAVVKVLAGREMGFGPIASMMSVHIVQGKPTIGADLMAAAVKRSGRYNYRVLKLDDNGCELAFFEQGTEIGRSSFGPREAEAAGLSGKQTYKQYPRNMFFARAMSNGVGWFCPDVLGGGRVYTPEEMGDDQAPEPAEVRIVDALTVEVPVSVSTTSPTAAELAKQAVAKGAITMDWIRQWCDARGVTKIEQSPERDRVQLAHELANKLAAQG